MDPLHCHCYTLLCSYLGDLQMAQVTRLEGEVRRDKLNRGCWMRQRQRAQLVLHVLVDPLQGLLNLRAPLREETQLAEVGGECWFRIIQSLTSDGQS